jgi:hypothetical protein
VGSENPASEQSNAISCTALPHEVSPSQAPRKNQIKNFRVHEEMIELSKAASLARFFGVRFSSRICPCQLWDAIPQVDDNA